jgi:hypothetical protein
VIPAGKKPGLDGRLDRQRINLFENRLEPLFQLLLRPWFAFRLCKLPVIGDGPPVKIGRFVQ